MSRIIPRISRIIPGISRIMPSISRIIHSISCIIPSLCRMMLSISRTIPSISRIIPSIIRIIPCIRQIIPSISRMIPSISLWLCGCVASPGRCGPLLGLRFGGFVAAALRARLFLPARLRRLVLQWFCDDFRSPAQGAGGRSNAGGGQTCPPTPPEPRQNNRRKATEGRHPSHVGFPATQGRQFFEQRWLHFYTKITISLPHQPSGEENLDFLTKPAAW